MKENSIDAQELFIIKKMVNGDKDAFKHFFETYYSELCNFVNLYLKDEMLSEEIVQDIFVHFWENRTKININKSVKSYLYSSSKYRSLNQIRNIKRHEEIHSKLETETQMEASYDEFDEEKLKDLLQRARQSLPPKCLQIFDLKQERRLSNKEISERLGISIKTVENQITIAYKRLRDYLQPFREQIFFVFIFSLLR
jgi:RNA polymerase sigma-70 factor (ECF subfamily)